MRNKRTIIGILCAAGLVLVYVMQKTDIASLFEIHRPVYRFLFNRTIRFILNDAFMIGIIYALFEKRKYVVFALWVQLAGVIFLLIPYFILKLKFPSYNGPLISYLHRLILNPTLILLLIPAFYFQEFREKSGG